MTNIKVVEVCGTWTDPWTGELVRNCHKIRVREEEPAIARKGLNSEGKGWSFHPGPVATAGADAQRAAGAAGKKNSLAENVDACVRELLEPPLLPLHERVKEGDRVKAMEGEKAGTVYEVKRRMIAGMEIKMPGTNLLFYRPFEEFDALFVLEAEGTPLLPVHDWLKVGERPFTFEELRVGDFIKSLSGGKWEVMGRYEGTIQLTLPGGWGSTIHLAPKIFAKNFSGFWVEPSHA